MITEAVSSLQPVSTQVKAAQERELNLASRRESGTICSSSSAVHCLLNWQVQDHLWAHYRAKEKTLFSLPPKTLTKSFSQILSGNFHLFWLKEKSLFQCLGFESSWKFLLVTEDLILSTFSAIFCHDNENAFMPTQLQKIKEHLTCSVSHLVLILL